VIQAAHRQIELLIHYAVGIGFHEPLLRLAEALATVTPEGLDTFFFSNSGSEAVEGAVKLARYVTRRPVVIAFQGGFHGRTYMSASITTAKAAYRLNYEPFVGSVYFAPYADVFHSRHHPDDPERCSAEALAELRTVLDRIAPPSEVACLVVEPVQGEGGYIIPPRAFLAGLRQICDEIGALLVFDEVQTGFGRTGQMFAAQTFDVRPDVMAIGKAIASGFPLSATVARADLMQAWLTGSHGTTFGGNPVSCAAALATLDIIEDEGLLANCRAQGARLLAGLQDVKARHELVTDVRGLGLMVALEFGQPDEPRPDLTRRVLDACLQRGLLFYMAGSHSQVIRIMPPLVLSPDHVDRAIGVVDDALTEVEKA
jgi:4-aminobutyrate aminotransferase